MGRLSKDQRDLLAGAYRGQPPGEPNHSSAARIANCHRRSARRCYLVGDPARGLAPISKLLEVERAGLRERVAAQESNRKALAAAAGDDATKQAAKEAMAARAVLDLALCGVQPALALWRFTHRMMETLKTKNPAEMSISDVVRTTGAVARISSRFADLTRSAMEIERLRLGHPSSVTKVVHEHHEFNPADAAADAQLLAEALRSDAEKPSPPALSAAPKTDGDGLH